MMNKVLLTGATGYVGGRLLRHLEEKGFEVRCLIRIPSHLSQRVHLKTEIIKGDVLDEKSLAIALKDIHTAFYFVHSMGAEESFETLDRKGAENFARIASESGVKRIIYLGALTQECKDLSPHLQSRLEVGNILREQAKGVNVIELRASIVIGSGSLSFEMVRSLSERLPLMIAPKWVWTEAQPIAITDLIEYLLQSMTLEIAENKIFEIGGADVTTYGGLMKEYARQRRLHRLIIHVPVLSPHLSSLWLGLVTPLYARVGRKLIDSATFPTIIQNHEAKNYFNVEPMGYVEAIALALNNEDKEFSETHWTDAVSSAASYRSWAGVRFGNRCVDSKEVSVLLPPKKAFAPIRRIGGETGWYFANFVWQLRGFFDLLIGGVGMHRARRDKEELRVGDVIDCWRVEEYVPDQLLRLRAEMKMPGRAWLQFEVRGHDGSSTIRQTVVFDPIGLGGIIYWYGLFPIHHIVFFGMLQNIAKAALKES